MTGERFPIIIFTWEGMDGTRWYPFLPTSYTYRTDPEEIGNVWKNRSQKEDPKAFLLPLAMGDGGGGPSRIIWNIYAGSRIWKGAPRMKMGSPEGIFHFMEEQGTEAHLYR